MWWRYVKLHWLMPQNTLNTLFLRYGCVETAVSMAPVARLPLISCFWPVFWFWSTPSDFSRHHLTHTILCKSCGISMRAPHRSRARIRLPKCVKNLQKPQSRPSWRPHAVTTMAFVSVLHCILLALCWIVECRACTPPEFTRHSHRRKWIFLHDRLAYNTASKAWMQILKLSSTTASAIAHSNAIISMLLENDITW